MAFKSDYLKLYTSQQVAISELLLTQEALAEVGERVWRVSKMEIMQMIDTACYPLKQIAVKSTWMLLSIAFTLLLNLVVLNNYGYATSMLFLCCRKHSVIGTAAEAMQAADTQCIRGHALEMNTLHNWSSETVHWQRWFGPQNNMMLTS